MKREISTEEEPPSRGTSVSLPPALPLPEAEAQLSLLDSLKSWIKQGLRSRSTRSSLEESVAELLEEHQTAGMPISEEERTLLNNIVEFGELTVSDIMVPRMDIVAVEHGSSLDTIKQTILEKTHTRMPVFRNTLDEMIGFIHIKDVIQYLDNEKPFVMDDILRPLLFVPPSMLVANLLVKMRSSRTHMALVLDEYGGTDGLATIDDVVGEIVGEIKDEHDDSVEEELVQVDDGAYEASARVEIEELQKVLGVDLSSTDESEDFDTLGGLIFCMLGRVPEQGEVLSHSAHLEFTILEADPRRIKRVLIRRQEKFAPEKVIALVETLPG